MAFPNGPWVLPGGKTYLVGETFGHRISAFDIASDGSLSNRRVWAPTGPKVFPDGVCWDEQRNALWVGNGGGKNVRNLKSNSMDEGPSLALLISFCPIDLTRPSLFPFRPFFTDSLVCRRRRHLGTHRLHHARHCLCFGRVNSLHRHRS